MTYLPSEKTIRNYNLIESLGSRYLEFRPDVQKIMRLSRDAKSPRLDYPEHERLADLAEQARNTNKPGRKKLKSAIREALASAIERATKNASTHQVIMPTFMDELAGHKSSARFEDHFCR